MLPGVAGRPIQVSGSVPDASLRITRDGVVMCSFMPQGLGWHRDLPDPRDLTPKHDTVVRLMHDLRPAEGRPERVDLRDYFGRARDQQLLATSSVHACLGLVQYFERRATGQLLEPSRMFVYRTARRLMGWSGDSGLPLRATLRAIARYGLPPEQTWPYDPSLLDAEPDGFVYASGSGVPGLMYVRLDGRGSRPEETLETVRRFLAAGFAIAFGFCVCTSISEEAEIPAPTVFDGVRGGQAVLAIGYDDQRRIRSDRGALLFANSWGGPWGDAGYGWLPYTYVREQLAGDFWTLMTPSWLASGELRRP
jgi:C1A family cysteine protease